MSAHSIEKQLEVIRSLGKEVNRISDEACRTLREVEEQLSTIGLPARVPIDDRLTLVYGRINGQYRIGLIASDGDEPGGPEALPWDNCPRMWKLMAAKHLPELLDEIIRQARELID